MLLINCFLNRIGSLINLHILVDIFDDLCEIFASQLLLHLVLV